MTKIAITGATGQLGRLTISAILRRDPGAVLVALVRDLDRSADLVVPLRQADYHQPEALRAALGRESLRARLKCHQYKRAPAAGHMLQDAARGAVLRHHIGLQRAVAQLLCELGGGHVRS